MRVEGHVLLLTVVAVAAACTRQGSSNGTSGAGAPGQVSAALSARAAAGQGKAALAASVPAKAVEAAADPLLPASVKTREQCAAICELSRQLRCKSPAQCLPNCLAMASATPCGQQINEFYTCLVGQPPARWQCDSESGVAQIREGFCEKEQAQTVSCMEAKMKP